MNLLQIQKRIGAAQTKVRAGLVGAVEFGASFVAQTRRMAHFDTGVICDRDAARARQALRLAGYDDEASQICDSAQAAKKDIISTATSILFIG